MRIIAHSLTALSMVMFLAVSAFANDDREALSREYVMMPEVQKMTDEMFSADALIAQFMAALPNTITVTEDQKKAIGELMAAEMAKLRPKLESVMIQNASTSFTAEELKALIVFYKSKHGASIMTKMQPYFQKTMAQLGPDFAKMRQSIGPQLKAIMTKK